MLVFGALLVYFLLWNLYFSFTDWSPNNYNYRFVGLGTYGGVIGAYYFRTIFVRTLLWTAGTFLFGNIMGVVLAALIFFLQSPRARTIYSSIFLYPLAISESAVAVIWSWIYAPSVGVDTFLRALGLPTFQFISSPSQSLPSLIVITTWIYSGLAAVFYLAAFQNVSPESIEAARIDGAGPIMILRKILLPEAKNAFIVSSALLIIFSLRIFTIPYASTGVNPTTTETLAVYLYQFFAYGYYADAASISIIIVVIAMVVIIPYAMLGIKRWLNA